MTKRQEIEIANSERRERINELLGMAERTDEQTTELRELAKAQQAGEVELRAALAVETPADRGGRRQRPTD